MDDVIFEEFKGTGNMEVHLDRGMSEKRIFPAIDIYKSGTRKEDLLLSKEELDAVYGIRRLLGGTNKAEVTEEILKHMITTKNNKEFITKINEILKTIK